ncbi:MATE family efflux transporter [Clostridium tepidum]|uniref:Multidrug export protein MepA n=1 Tax=Clostridium tepidum TaxID=1962263 RepID=A0A1S9IE07_9CLOT|nr:MATE family efflux transporter [Clostridium tepidum]MCR1934089.1 MATE family efflux transporter [Clostridium tepidum]MDU6877891.1 MATE family efflux transporter [Clostridium botulinum]OOO68561.1 MATE family efflux transporter [Clostridium tepidum]
MRLKSTFMRYILTNIIGMIGLSCYILADTFFVSKGLGVQGLTSLNLSISIYSFINATGLLIGIGGATKYSICKAQNKHNKANIIFTNSIKIGTFFGILFLLIGLLASSKLSTLLGADENIFNMTNIYLKTLLCFSPFFILNNIFVVFIRNDDNPKLSMIGMLIGSLSNIILDYVFIFHLKWEMFGAAFATGLAPIISMCILTRHYIKKKNSFHFCNSKLSIKQIPYICSLGISSFITEVASGIILIVFNLLILNISGNIGVAAYGIVANLALVATSIFTGIAQGTQPLLSENFGQSNNKKILQLFKYAIYTSLAVSIVLYFIIIIFNNQLVEIFNKDHIKPLSIIAYNGLIIYFTGFFFAGINIIISAVLSSINEPKYAFTISILRSGCIIIPLALFLSYLFKMTGIWLSFPLSEIITLILGSLLAKKSLKNF